MGAIEPDGPGDLYAIANTPEAKAFLESIHVEPTETNLQQLAVFAHCIRIHAQRTKRYGNAWSSRGWTGTLFHMDSKMVRLWSQFWLDDSRDPQPWNEYSVPDTDDAFDLINYCGFFIRNVQEGNKRGDHR